MKKKSVPITRDFEMILLAAERFACGRMSYIVDTVESYIEHLIPELSDWSLGILLQDLNEKAVQEERMRDVQEKYNISVWGMDCDKRVWMRLKEAIEAEQERRAKDHADTT